jgi:hypothetical protein
METSEIQAMIESGDLLSVKKIIQENPQMVNQV